MGRVSRQTTRHDDNYGNHFHPVVQRRLIRRRPFASWSVTERPGVAKPKSSLMDVLADCDGGGRVRRLQLLDGGQMRSWCPHGWMTHTCHCIVLQHPSICCRRHSRRPPHSVLNLNDVLDDDRENYQKISTK